MSLPIIIIDNTNEIGNYSAILKGRILTNGEITTYRFEYDIDSLFTTSLFSPLKTLQNSNEYYHIDELIEKLIVETNYYYRLIATNGSGTVISGTKLIKTNSVLYNSIELDTLAQSQKFVYKPKYRTFNQFEPNKRPSVFDVECIAQGIHNILTCRKKSRFFKNAFGCDWDNTVFELNDDYLLEDMLSYIIEALALWEPRAYIDIPSTTLTQLVDQYIARLNLGFVTNLNENVYQIGVFK